MVFGERFYQMSNAIFYYDLTPAEFMVYSYLVCCAGKKNLCWPSMCRIAVNCNCSENTARKAVASLVKKQFIRSVATYEEWQNGRSRQTNNTYYILNLPLVKSSATSAPQRDTGRPNPHSLRREAVCRGVCGFRLQHGALTRQTSEAPREPPFDAFTTPEGWENEKQDKHLTSNPVLFLSQLPAVRAVSGERE